MEKPTFQVAEFDAPLDLILHLIAKHKLNIYDIEISSLLEQYLAYIRMMEAEDLEVTSDFLEMASRLVYMKTVALLPRQEEEHEKLRAELTGQLLEYQLCKEVAAILRRQNAGLDLFVRRTADLPVDMEYKLEHDPMELISAYRDAVGKMARKLPPPREVFSPIVSKPIVSVTSRIIYLLRRFYRSGRLGVDRLYEGAENRSQLVATFLAVLELVKGGRLQYEDGGRELVLVSKPGSIPIS